MQTPPRLGVFVSSTWLDLQPEREAVEKALQRLRASYFVGMEYFGSRDENTRRASLDEVDRSHVYVGIFAARYGSGITEAEYHRARERGLKCFIYFKAEAAITLDKCEKDPAQQALLEKLKAELLAAHTVSGFTNPDELASKVTADLHNWIFDEYLSRAASAAPPSEAQAPALNALHQIPPPPGDFTGRADELADLSANIEGGVQISGLQGQGGIGKTALALKLADRLAPRFPDAQLYLDLKGAGEQQPLSASDAMSHVLRAYHPTAKLPEDEAELRALYLSVLHGQCALLLMDNARDAAQVEPLIPPSSCVLLVTSRQHFHLPGLYAKDLDTLPPADARALLLNIAPRIGNHADEIARLCGHLPLALRLAASFIAERRDFAAADYVRRLSDAKQRLKLIDASFSLSYDLLNPELQKFWRLLGAFPDTFDELAPATVCEVTLEEAKEALSTLVRYSMLEWNEVTRRYRLHDLARLFAEDRLSEDERGRARQQHATHYLAVLISAKSLYHKRGENLKKSFDLFDAEWENIQVGHEWAVRHAGGNHQALLLCAQYSAWGIHHLNLRLPPPERIKWFEAALDATRRLKLRIDEGAILCNIGVAYGQSGEHDRALEFFEQALDIAREVGDHGGEAGALGNLGEIYRLRGNVQSAIGYYKQHLQLARALGDRHSESVVLGNLGALHAVPGATDLCIEYHYHQFNIARDLDDPLGERNALSGLGIACKIIAESGGPAKLYQRAIEFHEKALAVDREIHDRDGEATALGSLGVIYFLLGDVDRAFGLYEQSLTINRDMGDISGEGLTLWNMSLALGKIGEVKQAISHAEDALRLLEHTKHPGVAQIRRQLDDWRKQSE